MILGRRIYEGDIAKNTSSSSNLEEAQPDSLVAEALSEVLQDLEAPYRPNVTSYDAPTTESYKEQSRPAYTATPDRDDETHPSALVANFRNLAIFSGQDERFAFRRAVSRLHEITSAEWHENIRHRPLEGAYRTWERGAFEGMKSPEPAVVEKIVAKAKQEDRSSKKLRMLKVDDLEEVGRRNLPPPKKIKEDHFWVSLISICK